MKFFSKAFNLALDLIFPVYCINCDTAGSSLCDKCLHSIKINPREIRTDKFIINYLYDFQSPLIHKALWQAKYHHNTGILKVLGEVLGKEIEQKFDKQNVFLIPIPLTKEDTRLHNHSLLLAKDTNFPICDILEKHTGKKQAHIEHRSERVENVKDKIKVSQSKLNKFLKTNNLNLEKIDEFNFILIDDTVTTGSTLLEAVKTLESQNIKITSIYTLAH